MGISSISIVDEIAKKIRDQSDVECSFYQSVEDASNPGELRSEKENLMTFDELLLEKQNTYVRGRYSNVDFFLFSSKLFQAPTPNYQREREFHVCFHKT